ncbi:MAG: HD domain-containing protein [Eubacterium sp.]|nr:HD domain-containing protein [Eubacterium sp.]
MTQAEYMLAENYMLSCMEDSAHDKEHIYRVLYNALEIAEGEPDVDCDVLIFACLLHDIGRKEQFDNPTVCHAAAGAEKAYLFLLKNGYDELFAGHVRDCIYTHRFRKSSPPQSIEAKILFDADKLDAAGASGLARTLLYKGEVGEPLYSMLPDGTVSDGTNDQTPSFFQEYRYKLENIYDKFYTAKGAALAAGRKQAAMDFYDSLYREMSEPYINGKSRLDKIIKER